MGLRNGNIPSENIYVSSNKQKLENIRLGFNELWKSSPNDNHPTVRVIFKTQIELSGFKIRGTADRVRVLYRDDESESYSFVQENYFSRLPAEMSGESRFLFVPIPNVRETVIELSNGFVSEQLTAQVEILGCEEGD